VKPHRVFVWTIGAALLLAAILGMTTASGQNHSGDTSGAKQWLAVMDTDHDGTVSKQEFLAYMGAQFDKADTDHDGTLSESELRQLRKNLMIAAKP
jgi:Ca2+-binding EF-hand superfamily protein